MFFNQCTEIHATKDDVVWEWQQRDQWRPYLPDSNTIEVMLLYFFCPHLTSSKAAFAKGEQSMRLRTSAGTLALNFKEMTQQNPQTGGVRAIRRRDLGLKHVVLDHDARKTLFEASEELRTKFVSDFLPLFFDVYLSTSRNSLVPADTFG
jgi:hypothetical protein